jgi:hypothetical protein
MVQRVWMAASLIVMLASLLFSGLLWHQSNQAINATADATRRLAEAQATNQAKTVELLTQSQSTNTEILKQLETIAKAAQSPQAPDWIPVTFKLTLESLDGPPTAGYQVTLKKDSEEFSDRGISRESDSSGLVDFGVVQPGDRVFEISTSWDEEHSWTCRGNLNVKLGTKVEKTVVCPRPRPHPVQSAVKLRVQWPTDLVEKNLRLEMTFVQAPTTFQPLLKWRVVDSQGDDRSRKIFYGPGFKQIASGGATKLELWHFYTARESWDVQCVLDDSHAPGVRSETDAVAMEVGHYLLQRLVVLRPCVLKERARKGEWFDVLAHSAAMLLYIFADYVTTYYSDLDQSQKPLRTPLSLDSYKRGVNVPQSYWSQLEERFSVRPGQVNDWTVPLPEELINVVREQLKRQEVPQADQTRPSATS